MKKKIIKTDQVVYPECVSITLKISVLHLKIYAMVTLTRTTTDFEILVGTHSKCFCGKNNIIIAISMENLV